MVSRLTQFMIRVIQADTVSLRGLRNVIDGEAELLHGFEFNINSILSSTLFAPYTVTIDRLSGTLSIAIPPFVPSTMIAAPQGTTHFKIISGGAEIDFEAGTFISVPDSTEALLWDTTVTTAIAPSFAVTPASSKPLFVALGLEFYQQVNGQLYSLKNGSYNPLAVVAVSGL